jgi:hypothetical protein
MGSQTAAAFAGLVAEGEIALDTALNYHFTANCYPALPLSLIPAAKEAIKYGKDEDWDHEIKLPKGISFRGQDHATARDCISGWRLNEFLE